MWSFLKPDATNASHVFRNSLGKKSTQQEVAEVSADLSLWSAAMKVMKLHLDSCGQTSGTSTPRCKASFLPQVFMSLGRNLFIFEFWKKKWWHVLLPPLAKERIREIPIMLTNLQIGEGWKNKSASKTKVAFSIPGIWSILPVFGLFWSVTRCWRQGNKTWSPWGSGEAEEVKTLLKTAEVI